MGGFTGGGGADASGNSGNQKKKDISSITKRDAARFRQSQKRTKKSVSKSKLDNYQMPKSDAPGAVGVALNVTQKARQKSFEKNRDYFQKNVAGKRGYEDTFEDYERYITGRGSGELDAMGRQINTGGGGGNQGIEIANQSGTLAAETQQAAVDDAPTGPTSIEMAANETEAERLVKNKRKGRRSTILNKPEGLDEDVELGKKYLLG